MPYAMSPYLLDENCNEPTTSERIAWFRARSIVAKPIAIASQLQNLFEAPVAFIDKRPPGPLVFLT